MGRVEPTSTDDAVETDLPGDGAGDVRRHASGSIATRTTSTSVSAVRDLPADRRSRGAHAIASAPESTPTVTNPRRRRSSREPARCGPDRRATNRRATRPTRPRPARRPPTERGAAHLGAEHHHRGPGPRPVVARPRPGAVEAGHDRRRDQRPARRVCHGAAAARSPRARPAPGAHDLDVASVEVGVGSVDPGEEPARHVAVVPASAAIGTSHHGPVAPQHDRADHREAGASASTRYARVPPPRTHHVRSARRSPRRRRQIGAAVGRLGCRRSRRAALAGPARRAATAERGHRPADNGSRRDGRRDQESHAGAATRPQRRRRSCADGSRTSDGDQRPRPPRSPGSAARAARTRRRAPRARPAAAAAARSRRSSRSAAPPAATPRSRRRRAPSPDRRREAAHQHVEHRDQRQRRARR